MESGIYKITNTVSNKIYIGSSIDLILRLKAHLNDLRGKRHVNTRLQNGWNKYGEDAFKFEQIEVCSEEDLLVREQFYIDALNPFYNICRTAGSVTGTKRSLERK